MAWDAIISRLARFNVLGCAQSKRCSCLLFTASLRSQFAKSVAVARQRRANTQFAADSACHARSRYFLRRRRAFLATNECCWRAIGTCETQEYVTLYYPTQCNRISSFVDQKRWKCCKRRRKNENCQRINIKVRQFFNLLENKSKIIKKNLWKLKHGISTTTRSVKNIFQKFITIEN